MKTKNRMKKAQHKMGTAPPKTRVVPPKVRVVRPDTEVIRHKTKTVPQKIEMTKINRKQKASRIGFSMGKRISVSYIRMLADAFLSGLILVLIVYIVFNVYVLTRDVIQITNDLSISRELTESIYNTVIQRDTEIELADLSGESMLNTFGSYQKPIERLPVWFFQKDRSVYIMIQTYINRSEGTYRISVFKDVTLALVEMGVLFGAALVLGTVILLTIFFRGRSMTRNVLYPIAEMTEMTKNIKAQNLNLRLNVTNAKDELKELVITFNSMMDRIENAYNKQNQFVSDASHELRTPISVVQGYARMLERWGKEDPEVLQESIEAIRNESNNMKELVDKLLFIARNDKDTLIITKERFSLSEMMDELVKETRMVDEQHTIEASIDENIEIVGDRNRIKQAMRIFVDNAQKYTESGKCISIKLEDKDEYVTLSVRDSGCGIDKGELPNVFDRFYRADESRDRNRGGHGLGLSIAKIIILRHGGKINVKSKMNEGSVFSVILKKG